MKMSRVQLDEYIRKHHADMTDKEISIVSGYHKDTVKKYRRFLGISNDKKCRQTAYDETGNVYGKLTVLCKDSASHPDGAYWVCKCECGNIAVVKGANLRNKQHPVRSCGCSYNDSHITLWNNGTWKRINMDTVECCKCGKQKVLGGNHACSSSYMVMCDCVKEEIRKEKRKKYCIYCGALLPNRKRRVCDECNHKHDIEKRRIHQRRRGTLSERRRYKRAKQNGKIDWSISLDKLMVRDKNVCALCGEPVDVNDYHVTDDGAFVAHMKYPSVDHILPLNRGGTHTWDNVQLAHFMCNSIKGDSIEGEVL